MIESWREAAIDLSYIVAAILFIIGLKRLSNPATARQGNQLSAIGMALAIIATLFIPDLRN
ncbi:MAG: NAD(P)(+) transhydrogenase (Re/Si-specific) subunit beta, partial [Chloroflexota bacterium]|nr:NAD(P)(+) transhydrogenase (Re/Si-specific) subunit beta [Chloroflexota bacterium]